MYLCALWKIDIIATGFKFSECLIVFSFSRFLFLRSSLLAVFEYGLSLHENIQSDLHDVINWPLEWLSAIPSAHATRISIKFLGGD